MIRTEIVTPRCGPITKLVVSISSGQTKITYADDSSRASCANPSWLTYNGRMADLSPMCEPAPKDYPKEAKHFLERHFGTNSHIRVSEAAKKRLELLDLTVLSYNDIDLEENKPVVWHEVTLEEVELPPAQRASIVEYKEPETDSIKILNFAWHLQNCRAWELIISDRYRGAKCFCPRIRKIMDTINDLVEPEMFQIESSEDDSAWVPALSEKVQSASFLLKKLHNLLDLQKEVNLRYQDI
ncbi:uncharacterized protein [Drosophila bipectinata]|uniref:uncharacterized protein n=1 Tax=Drosophila bipectinata TaxID=42026 RepID=UPI001C8A36CF|nr:uncharacterized protein LOC108133135 [Drosophila bipectinata]